MELTVELAAERLQRGQVLATVLFDGLSDALARWKPAPERWSLLEVVNHLADEEALDFRARIRSTLEDPARPWPPIAPQEWPAQRKYNERDPRESLDRFTAERRASLAWLRGQAGADWSRTYVHPKAGPLSARMLLANWLAHDLLHGRQMLALHHAWLARQAAPDALEYAGPW